ncbi:hypothetical protein P4S72_24560 [Vibrio sp. PP-XX7]
MGNHRFTSCRKHSCRIYCVRFIVYHIDINPIDAIKVMWVGAFGYAEGFGYTLYYTTGFIFTGLAVAVAYHAGLFNIGVEGQSYIGGLGVGLVCLTLGEVAPWYVVFPVAILAGGLFGAAWAFLPAYLQAKRGSHIVITTIMFNFHRRITHGLFARRCLKTRKLDGNRAGFLPQAVGYLR